MRGSDQRTASCSPMSTSRSVSLSTLCEDPTHCQRRADRTRCGLVYAVTERRSIVPERPLRRRIATRYHNLGANCFAFINFGSCEFGCDQLSLHLLLLSRVTVKPQSHPHWSVEEVRM